VRIVKEISRVSDRAMRARIFTPIAGSRKSALEAIARDHNFSRRRAQIVAIPLSATKIFSRSKKNFRFRQFSAEISDDI